MTNEVQPISKDRGEVIPVSLGNFSLSLDPLGGKVRGIVPEYLQRNVLFEPDMPFTLEGVRGHRFEVAGWDEACPSVAESSGIPQLGWAWQTQTEMDLKKDSFRTTWQLPSMAIERTLTSEERILTSSYQFQNARSEAVPFLWASHVLYSVDGLLDIDMPGGQLIPGPGCLIQEVENQIDRSLPWSRGKRELDQAEQSGDVPVPASQRLTDNCTRIHDFTDIGLSWKFFVPADGPLNLNFSDKTLCVRTTAPWFGVFLNRGRFGTPCLGIEPTTHATDYVADADQLVPGEIRRFSWSLEYKSHA